MILQVHSLFEITLLHVSSEGKKLGYVAVDPFLLCCAVAASPDHDLAGLHL